MALTKATYSMIQGAPVNVLDFGAVGDGTADDTAAINAALTAGAGQSVFFPKGTYKVSANLVPAANTTMFGSGWGSVIKVDAAATRFIPILVNSTSEVLGVCIRDLAVDGSQKGLLDAGLIQLNGAAGFVVERVRLFNGGTPGESAVQGVNGIAAAVDGLGNSGSFGVIRDCLIEACTKGGINITTETQGVLVEGCTVRNCTGNTQTPGIQINGGYNARVIGNRVSGCQGVGIFAATSGGVGTYRYPKDTVIEGNTVFGNGTGSVTGHGIYVANAQGQASGIVGKISIIGNHCYSNGVVFTTANGIRVENQDDVVISGNISYSNSGIGIGIQNTRQTVVSGNIVNDNNTSNNSDVSGVYVQAVGTSVVQRLTINNNIFRNNAGSFQQYPIYFDVLASSSPNTCMNDVQVLDNDSSGHAVGNFPAGTFPSSLTLRQKATFQSASVSYQTVAVWLMCDEAAYSARIVATANQSDSSNRALYDRSALMYRDGGGSATLQGAVAEAFAPIESDATWDATFDVTANVGYVKVLSSGLTADWNIRIELSSV